ncbi:MAG: PspC domain-containing protein [Pseudonocardiales bacterium]|nr:PspC domain-containing protein [Pseudonocardiales bacterium]
MAERRVRRSRERVLGGVCAGVAEHLGVDALPVRLAVVLIALVTGGFGVLAYLLAWVLLPPPAEGAAPPAEIPATARTPAPRPAVPAPGAAWRAVGGEVRTLAGGVRAAVGGVPRTAGSPLDTADAAATALGEHLRTPEVGAGLRRTAQGLATAVTATVDEAARRARRDGGA